jgi:YbgC/YbaW family acyl-CoA thioester hydrolase
MEFVETDMAGIVHFSNFFRFMEAAEVSFLQSLGLSVRYQYDKQTYSLPRVAAACDFLRPVRFEDIVEIAVTVAKLGRSSITYDFHFFHEGQPIARGRVTCVFCRVLADDRLESIDMPKEFRAKLQPYMAAPDTAS